MKLSVIVFGFVLAAGCSHKETKEAAAGSAEGSARGSAVVDEATSGSGSGSSTSESSGSGSGSGSGSASASGSGSGSATTTASASDAADPCEAYYAAEVKFATEQHRKLTGKHDAFVAACHKLPAELQTCQGDWKYAAAHDDACSKLLAANLKPVRALRMMVAGM